MRLEMIEGVLTLVTFLGESNTIFQTTIGVIRVI
jgi:hypothetical protein